MTLDWTQTQFLCLFCTILSFSSAASGAQQTIDKIRAHAASHRYPDTPSIGGKRSSLYDGTSDTSSAAKRFVIGDERSVGQLFSTPYRNFQADSIEERQIAQEQTIIHDLDQLLDDFPPRTPPYSGTFSGVTSAASSSNRDQKSMISSTASSIGFTPYSDLSLPFPHREFSDSTMEARPFVGLPKFAFNLGDFNRDGKLTFRGKSSESTSLLCDTDDEDSFDHYSELDDSIMLQKSLSSQPIRRLTSISHPNSLLKQSLQHKTKPLLIDDFDVEPITYVSPPSSRQVHSSRAPSATSHLVHDLSRLDFTKSDPEGSFTPISVFTDPSSVSSSKLKALPKHRLLGTATDQMASDPAYIDFSVLSDSSLSSDEVIQEVRKSPKRRSPTPSLIKQSTPTPDRSSPFYEPHSGEEDEQQGEERPEGREVLTAPSPVNLGPNEARSRFVEKLKQFHAITFAKSDKKTHEKSKRLAEERKRINSQEKKWRFDLEHNQIPDFSAYKSKIKFADLLQFIKDCATNAGNDKLIYEEALHDVLFDYYFPLWIAEFNFAKKAKKTLETELKADLMSVLKNLITKMAAQYIFERAIKVMTPYLTRLDQDDLFRTIIDTGLSIPWPLEEPHRRDFRPKDFPNRPANLLSEEEIEAIPLDNPERARQEEMAYRYNKALQEFHANEKRLSKEYAEAETTYRFQRARFERATSHLAFFLQCFPDSLYRARGSVDSEYLNRRNLPNECFRDYLYFGRFYVAMLMREPGIMFDLESFRVSLNHTPLFPSNVPVKITVMEHLFIAMDHFVSWSRYIHYPLESREHFLARQRLFNLLMGQIRMTLGFTLTDLIGSALRLRLSRLLEAILVFSREEMSKHASDLEFIMTIFTENQPFLTIELGTIILSYVSGWDFAAIDPRLQQLAQQPGISDRRVRLFSALREVAYILSGRFAVDTAIQTILYDPNVFSYFPTFGSTSSTPYLIHAMRGIALRSFSIPFVQTSVTYLVNEPFTWREAVRAVNLLLKPFGIVLTDGMKLPELPFDEPSNPVHSHLERLAQMYDDPIEQDFIRNSYEVEMAITEELSTCNKEIDDFDASRDISYLDAPDQFEELYRQHQKYRPVDLSDARLKKLYETTTRPLFLLRMDDDDEWNFDF